MSTAPATYRTYWIAWLALLGLTLVMVGIASRPVLIVGMIAKATIIALWFMHLRYERPLLSYGVLVAIFLTALVLFGLIAPDAAHAQT